jgi:hypothetical protein
MQFGQHDHDNFVNSCFRTHFLDNLWTDADQLSESCLEVIYE